MTKATMKKQRQKAKHEKAYKELLKVLPNCVKCGKKYFSYDYVIDPVTNKPICVYCAYPIINGEIVKAI